MLQRAFLPTTRARARTAPRSRTRARAPSLSSPSSRSRWPTSLSSPGVVRLLELAGTPAPGSSCSFRHPLVLAGGRSRSRNRCRSADLRRRDHGWARPTPCAVDALRAAAAPLVAPTAALDALAALPTSRPRAPRRGRCPGRAVPNAAPYPPGRRSARRGDRAHRTCSSSRPSGPLARVHLLRDAQLDHNGGMRLVSERSASSSHPRGREARRPSSAPRSADHPKIVEVHPDARRARAARSG